MLSLHLQSSQKMLLVVDCSTLSWQETANDSLSPFPSSVLLVSAFLSTSTLVPSQHGSEAKHFNANHGFLFKITSFLVEK